MGESHPKGCCSTKRQLLIPDIVLSIGKGVVPRVLQLLGPATSSSAAQTLHAYLCPCQVTVLALGAFNPPRNSQDKEKVEHTVQSKDA